MKNNFVPKTFPHKTASTVVIQVFAAAWQLGNTGLEKLGLVHRGPAHFELFPRNADASGLPFLLLAVPGDVREHQRPFPDTLRPLKIQMTDKNEKDLVHYFSIRFLLGPRLSIFQSGMIMKEHRL